MTEEVCPLCMGKCQVIQLRKNTIFVDNSDIIDCPACIEGMITIPENITDPEKIVMRNDIVNQFQWYCAI